MSTEAELDRWLDVLAATEPFRAAVRELAGCYFERERARAVRDGFRAALDAGPAGPGHGWLGAAMALVGREARLSAGPRESAPAPREFAVLRDELNERVCRRFPSPIAVCWHRLENVASGPSEELCAMLDTAESTLLFLATLLVGHRAERGEAASDSRFDAAICAALLAERPSLGQVADLVEHGMRHLSATDPSAFVSPDVVGALAVGGKPTRAMELLAGFVSLRNRALGHARGRVPERYAPLVELCRPDLAAVLDALRPLEEATLVRPLEVRADGTVGEHFEHRGTTPMRRREPSLPPLRIEERHRGPGGLVRRERFLWVPPSAREPRMYLPLFPFASVAPPELGPRADAPYLLCAASFEQVRVGWAELDTYEVGDACVRLRDDTSSSPATRELLDALWERTSGVRPAGARSGARGEHARDEAARHDLPAVWDEQQAHHRGFVGRGAWVDRLAAPGAGRYVLVLGAAGTGKSALLAETYERGGERALLHMVKAEREPEVFVRFLLAQVSRHRERLGLGALGAEVWSAVTSASAAPLWREVEALAPRLPGGEALVLLDGLDELPERVLADPWFLPPRAPDGVRIVLACRPDVPLVPALRARLSPVEETELSDGLGLHDVGEVLRQVLRARRVAANETAVERAAAEVHRDTAGHPLFVKLACEVVADDAPHLRLAAPGATERAWLEMAWTRATGRVPGQPADDAVIARERVLAMLALVHGRAALDADQLQGALEASGVVLSRAELLAALGRMRGYLVEDRAGALSIFHAKLAEHVAGHALSERDRRRVHGWLAAWLEADDGGTERAAGWSRHGLAHRVWHLRQAGRAADAAALLGDFGYLSARVTAGGPAAVTPIEEDCRETAKAVDGPALAEWSGFWRASGHVVRRGDAAWPAERTLLQRAWEQGTETAVTRAVEAHVRARGGVGWPMLRQRHRVEAPPRSACLRVLEYYFESFAVHPDGRRAISAAYWDKALRVWDLETGTCERVLESHTDSVESFALHADQRRAVSTSKDRTLRVWDLETGICERVLAGHQRVVTSVALHPDGRRAISASDDCTLRVWDLETGTCERVLEGHWPRTPSRPRVITSVALHTDGRRAVSAGSDWTLRVWDLETGTRERVLIGHKALVSSVTLHPDGRRAVSTSWDGKLRVWDLETGICERVLDGLDPIALHPDGRMAVSASSDGTLRVWDLKTGICERVLEGHTSRVDSIVLHPDARRAVSASNDGTLRVWDLKTGICERVLEGHAGQIKSVALHPDGRRAVSASSDGTLRVWDLEAVPDRVSERHSASVSSVAISADGRSAISASDDKTLRLWDLETGKCGRVFEGHAGQIKSVALHPDGRRAVSASWDKTLRLWDLETGECERVLEGHTWHVDAVALHPDGRRAISASFSGLSASDDKTLRMWDLETGTCERVLELESCFQVTSVALHPDGRRAISTSDEVAPTKPDSFGSLRVWDLETGTCERVVEGLTGFIHSVALHPNGRHAVLASWNESLRVWNLETGTCERVLEGDPRGVGSIAVLADGRRVSVGDNRTLRLCDLDTGALVARWDGDHAVTACACARSGAIVTGDASGAVLFLELLEAAHARA